MIVLYAYIVTIILLVLLMRNIISKANNRRTIFYLEHELRRVKEELKEIWDIHYNSRNRR